MYPKLKLLKNLTFLFRFKTHKFAFKNVRQLPSPSLLQWSVILRNDDKGKMFVKWKVRDN